MQGNIDIVIGILVMFAIAWICEIRSERKAQKSKRIQCIR